MKDSRYEEALERARAGKPLYEVFPEQKESRDERIRKWLIEEIKATHDYDSPTSRKCVDDALAYLERQKEQQPAECIPDSVKFEEGFKTGRELGFREGVESVKPAEWSEEDEIRLDSIISSYRELLQDYNACHDVDYIPYTSDTLIRNVVDDVNFLKSIPRLHPKQEWSEEDKKILNEIITIMDGGKITSGTYLSEYAAWLKDLPKRFNLQHHWRPSEEQMKALEEVRTIFHHHHLWDEINPILYDYEELMRDLQKLL